MSDGKMFCATLWEEDGTAFQYTVRIDEVGEHPERPVLHNPSGTGRDTPDDLGADRPLPEEQRPEEVAPDRPAATLVEKVAIAMTSGPRAAIAVVLRKMMERTQPDWSVGDLKAGKCWEGMVKKYARENGIELK